MKKILCIGGVTTDITLRPVDQLPMPGTLGAVEQMKISVGGCAANVAIDLARLGVDAAVCCKVGEDVLGEFVKAEFSANGVDTGGVATTSNAGTSTSVVSVNSCGERNFLYYPGATSELSEEDISPEVMDQCQILFIGSALLLLKLDGEPAKRLLKKAREKGKYTVMDTVWDFEDRWLEKIQAAIPYLDLFMPSVEEAAKLTGETEPGKMADRFFELGAKNVIIKLGKTGAYICEAGRARYISPAFLQERPVDTNGAGDAFCAGFLCGLANDLGYEKSAELANAVGSHCVMETGAYGGIVPMEAVHDFIRARKKEENRI